MKIKATIAGRWYQSDFEPRKKVWLALSELFLDTDVTLSENHVVRELAESPYDIDTIEKILEQEVAPVCRWNIIWWEWAGFDQQWLEDAIIRRLSRPIIFRLPMLFGRHGFGPRGYWNRIKFRVEKTRETGI